MRRVTSSVLTLAACAALLILGGCGGSKFPMAEVKGKVLLDGQPVNGGTVSFIPDTSAGNKGPMSSGPISAQGEFTLVSAEGAKGAVVGSHKVIVVAPFDVGSSGSSASGDTTVTPTTPSKIPPTYANPADSDLRAEVRAGKTNEINLELRSK